MQCKDIPDKLVIRMAKEAGAGGPCVFDALVRLYPVEKVCVAKLERMNDRGLLECGTGVEWSWPTDAGLELLNDSA